ncbi:hypothetical protein ACEWY4_010576 [Coilia grayii]|uniref:Protein zwilch n=1 Tax=Coilia grayii TaxID=363190 RepID=A0ABD1K2A3_9TELE
MRSTIISDANRFVESLKGLCQKNTDNELIYEDNVQISLVNHKVPLHKLVCGNLPVLVAGRKLKLENAQDDSEDSLRSEDLPDTEAAGEEQKDTGPQPLPLKNARQLLSWYTMTRFQNMSTVACAPLPPLWVRCDMSDPLGTAWLGAEPISTGNKVSAIKLYTICSKGATVDKSSFISLDELMQLHQKRHHASAVETKGYAQYDLFGSMEVENTIIESQCSIIAVFRWSNVEKIFQMPLPSSEAVLDITLAIGDMKSPLYETYKELDFLETLAQGLQTGEAEWPDPTDRRSAVDLTKALVEELESIAKTGHGPAGKGAEALNEDKPDTPSQADKGINIYSAAGLERGDLDFTDQLWVKMRSSITSYQDITDCLKMVISAVKHGQIKPRVHRNSSNSLGRLILQSYKQQMEEVCLSGLTPVHMLLQMGLDKMRKDYINYLIGRDLTTLNNLSYYLSTDVDPQEQVTRVKKLHHLLEILVICTTFLNLPHECLFPFIQSCLKYYKTSPYDEKHVFQMQIRPVMISKFYQKEEPMAWGVEVFSGQGSREVRTSFHLSNQPLVDHVTFSSDFNKTTMNGEKEETAFFSTMVTHSLINVI